MAGRFVYNTHSHTVQISLLRRLFFYFFLSFVFLFISFPKLLISLCELVRVWEILGDKTLANDHTAAATVEATAAAVRSNRKLYMITAWFTANNKHNQMADRHYYFDFFLLIRRRRRCLLSFLPCLVCLCFIHILFIHYLCVGIFSNIILWLYSFAALTFVRLYDLMSWRSHGKEERKRDKKTNPNKTTNKHTIIYSSKKKQRHTRNRKKYIIIFFRSKKKNIFILKHIRYTHSFGFVE